jgi:hypothetical protein
MRLLSVLAPVLFLLAPGGALAAATMFQASLVPNESEATPGFRASGSSLKLVSAGNLRLMGKLKGVVDGSGDEVTTDPGDPDDDYCVEVDLFVAATAQAGTAEVCFDVRNGNASFKANLGGEPALAGSAKGDGVTVREIRVLDGAGLAIGSGGVALRN